MVECRSVVIEPLEPVRIVSDGEKFFLKHLKGKQIHSEEVDEVNVFGHKLPVKYRTDPSSCVVTDRTKITIRESEVLKIKKEMKAKATRKAKEEARALQDKILNLGCVKAMEYPEEPDFSSSIVVCPGQILEIGHEEDEVYLKRINEWRQSISELYEAGLK